MLDKERRYTSIKETNDEINDSEYLGGSWSALKKQSVNLNVLNKLNLADFQYLQKRTPGASAGNPKSQAPLLVSFDMIHPKYK